MQELLSIKGEALLFCHQNADGDALGSTLTWAEYLKQQGWQARVIAPDMFPDFLQWLPGCNDVVRYDKHKDEVKAMIERADLLCFMDLNCMSRTSMEMQDVLLSILGEKREDGTFANKKVMLIDHHLSPDIVGDLQVSHPTLSSTSEIVFRLIWQLGGYDMMTKEMAITTYCGMMTDTGGFTFNSNQPEVFFIISQLLQKGIDKDKIYRNIYHVFSVDRLRLTGYVMYQKLKVLTPLRASYYAISKEDQKRFHFIKGDAEGLVNMPLQIKGHRLSISLREDTEKKDTVWVSLRSVDDFPCNKVAEQFFNGGGHKNASGGRLYCSLQEAEQITRKAIQTYAAML